MALRRAANAIAIAVFQPNGVSELPGSTVVFIAGVALSPPFAIAVGVAVTAGVTVAVAVPLGLAGGPGAASALLCAVLGGTGAILRRYRISQANTELLLAQFEEARDDQARAAAAEERATIARDLHDVLAHSLSGLSIQLEMVRKLASKADVPPELLVSIDGAAGLAKQGLTGARDAVGALRRGDQLGVDQLPELVELVEHFRRDLGLAVAHAVRGTPRPVAPDLGLALYRVGGEALMNVARHAAGASTRVELSFDAAAVRLGDRRRRGAEHARDRFAKIGVRSRVQAVRYAIGNGLTGPGSTGPAGPGRGAPEC